VYWPALKNAIQNLEEKRFYDVALMYLTQLGYRDLRIVDGKGDGGRDVTCSRDDLRIQLSVRKDWERKINEEASNTALAGLHHLIFITNRPISPQAEQEFLQTKYTHKGSVDVTLHDLGRISTSLAQPGVIRQAYEMLGMAVPSVLSATPKEIALSTILVFSRDAKELRDEVLEATVRAVLLKAPEAPESTIIQKVVSSLPGVNIDRAAKAALTRLRTAGRIVGTATKLRLSETERTTMEAAETEFLISVANDVQSLTAVTGLPEADVRRLLSLSLELLVRNRDFDGSGPLEESVRSFLAEHGLSRKREQIYAELAKTSSARIRQYGATIDQIFSTNTFDIYRALGRRTDITVVLDSSVAMPIIFGLEFGAAKSRYGVAALALKEACQAHKISMSVPRCYLNEMAAHGLKALEWLEIYGALPEDAKAALRASGNAYLSHYTHISETVRASGDQLELKEFLAHFGVVAGRSISRIENRISSLLEQHDIVCVPDVRWDQDIRNKVVEGKPNEFRILIDHDAMVCTMLKNDDAKGFILATWDGVIIEIVEDVARVFADTPARVIDFLSMAAGQNFECEQSFELLSSLLYVDEKVAQRLAAKIEKIHSVEQAYKLRAFVDSARQRDGSSWVLKPEDVAPFLDEDHESDDARNVDLASLGS